MIATAAPELVLRSRALRARLRTDSGPLASASIRRLPATSWEAMSWRTGWSRCSTGPSSKGWGLAEADATPPHSVALLFTRRPLRRSAQEE